LQAKLHDEPIARDQRRLAELEDLAKNLEDEHLRLRQRVLAVSDADVANSVAAIAELDRKRLDVELDLRTEEAAQDSLQKMTMETQKRHETLSTQAVELGRQQLKLRSSVTNLRNSLRTSEGHENELKQIDELNSKADDLMQACSSATAEVTRCATQLDAIAEEARKATLSIHRLTARLQVLQSMLEQQRKLAASAQAALFEREAAQVRAEEAKARLTSVRQRAEEIRVRLDAIEPVRLEVWK
jgi:chromosome segregation ATPase